MNMCQCGHDYWQHESLMDPSRSGGGGKCRYHRHDGCISYNTADGLTKYEIGIVYRFWAEDERHAVEQFVDALDGLDNAILVDLKGHINWIHPLPGGDTT